MEKYVITNVVVYWPYDFLKGVGREKYTPCHVRSPFFLIHVLKI
jgi:hypothetical protein